MKRARVCVSTCSSYINTGGSKRSCLSRTRTATKVSLFSQKHLQYLLSKTPSRSTTVRKPSEVSFSTGHSKRCFANIRNPFKPGSAIEIEVVPPEEAENIKPMEVNEEVDLTPGLGKVAPWVQNLDFDELESITDELRSEEVYTPHNIHRQFNRTIFKDAIYVHVQAGSGGNGCIAFTRQAYRPEVPPDGGDGGDGGSVYAEVGEHYNNLSHIKTTLQAENGRPGQGNHKHGKKGQDLRIKVPAGTVIRKWDEETETAGELLADLNQVGEQVLLAKGGKGGLGNTHFVSGSNRSPKLRTKGKPGEALSLLIELKCIADIGLVGMPNAGKSTILSVITNAIPKIASYPFTTLNPYVGMIEYDDDNKISIADLPGLVEGAHRNRGLGHKFLKHIERTKVLCYVLDMSAALRDPYDDFITLRSELNIYNPDLVSRPHIIVANKMDLPTSKEQLKKFKKQVEIFNSSIIPISALHKRNLSELKRILRLAVRGDEHEWKPSSAPLALPEYQV